MNNYLLQQAKQQIDQQINQQYLEQNKLRQMATGGLEEMRQRTRDRLTKQETGKGGIIRPGVEEGKLRPSITTGNPAGQPKVIVSTLPTYKVAKNWNDYDILQNQEKAQARKENRKPNYSLIKRPGFVPPKSVNLRIDYAGSIPNVIKNPDYNEFFAGRDRMDTKAEYEKNKIEVWQDDFYSYDNYVKNFNIKSKPFILNPKFDTDNKYLTSKVVLLNPLGQMPIEKKNEIIKKLGGTPQLVYKPNPLENTDKKLSNIPNKFNMLIPGHQAEEGVYPNFKKRTFTDF